MSLIKDLKAKPENNINFVDLVCLLVPEGKSKYVEMLLRIMRSTENVEDYKKEVIERMSSEYGINPKELKGIDATQLILMEKILKELFVVKDIKNFVKFCDYNERGIISQNDVSRYTSFEQINTEINKAELIITEKEMEKQVIKMYDDNEWIVLKPLTFEASKKYGANTKWCTTEEKEPSHFERYAKGILIYSINKKNNYKVATYKDLSGQEVSFWNSTDQKIDSLDSELPDNILKLIREELKTCKSGNISLYKPKDTQPLFGTKIKW